MMSDCIDGPCEGHRGKVSDLASYRSFHGQAMSRKSGVPHQVEESRNAYINHGRWVVDCDCNGAGFASREWKISCCFDCGAVYTSVTFPRNASKIEKTLLKRNPENRNWNHGETLKILIQENVDHGLPMS